MVKVISTITSYGFKRRSAPAEELWAAIYELKAIIKISWSHIYNRKIVCLVWFSFLCTFGRLSQNFEDLVHEL